MSQMIYKINKEKPRVCPHCYPTIHQDGKTDAEIKAIFEEVIPQILEEQAKGYDCSFPLWRTDPLGAQLHCQGTIIEKSIQRKMMIQNS